MSANSESAPEFSPAAPAPAPLAFEAELEHDSETGGVYVVVPPAVTAALGPAGGPRARLAVRATFDGFPHNGLLTPLPAGAEGEYILLVPKQVRKAIGKTWTNDVAVTLAPDPEAQALDLPADLLVALAAVRGSRARFNQLSKAHQREYVAWIAAAKTEQGRAERVAQTAERMLIGVRRRSA
ncbi:YdeI/OmpD-associated family protein [uncultured Hymenobacter sp.]|uniref:YdeI/OmpD-associated family protein n=1 Tax=uncultured Hymenobacter sp. TaxID=170016 RepID=UPI0035CABE89